jgi:site-specific DNA recombinase
MPERSTVGYIRVSTKEQAETKLSLIRQEEKIRAYGLAQDLTITRIFNDAAESAKNLNRPAMKELLAEVELGKVGHVIVYKLDRIIRNVENLGFLLRLFEKKKVTFASVCESLDTSSASGRMVVNLLGMIAQWERETISERTKQALDVKRKRGERLGGILPYGFREQQGKLVPHEHESRILKAIVKANRDGRGYKDIAEALNNQGVKPRSGARWYASTIRSICLREGATA